MKPQRKTLHFIVINAKNAFNVWYLETDKERKFPELINNYTAFPIV